MVPSYRTLHHWNHWLSQHFLGEELLTAERNVTAHILKKYFGKQALLIGVPHQIDLLKTVSWPAQAIMTPLSNHQHRIPGIIEGDLHELPIMTGSIDLVLLPHALEFIDNPRQLLAEACRIVKPEGLIMIYGFNPYGIWRIKKAFAKNKPIPSAKIKSWLHLADFQLEQQKHFLFRPPLSRKSLYHKLHFLEPLGRRVCPLLGGVYVLLARAKVIPLTPIRLKWRQELNKVSIPTSITGHIAW